MPKTSASSITRQLQLVFAVSIALLLLSSAASFYANRELINTTSSVNHTYNVILATENLISSVKDAETSQRGFIITDDPEFLEGFTGGREHSLQIWESLTKLTADNPAQQEPLDKIRSLIESRYDQMQRTYRLAAATPAGERPQLFMDSHEEMLRGKKIMDQLREQIEAVKREEGRLLRIRTENQERFTTYTPALSIVVALISVLISISAYFRIKSDLEERVRKQKEEEEKYRETAERINAMEQVTFRIASGDYSSRSADEGKDELGKISTALNAMAVALEENFGELEKKAWLQDGTVKLSDAVRSERSPAAVAGKIINSVAGHLNAPVGTLYLAGRNAALKLAGSYAISNAPDEIAPGEGMLGQSVRDKQILVSERLPADYLSVSSSIGSTKPLFVIILPLVYSDHVIGVLELGMLHSPEENELQFLRANMEAMAISLNAAVNYEKLQELLDETQAQSEELQAQHSELESINATLEMQTEKLQASDEELRVQQEELQQANLELEERSRLLEERNQEISERNLEIQRQAEELITSARYKSEFLANMSHELRTPLNSILLLSRLLSEDNEKSLSKEQVEYAKVIQSSGNGLLQLIDEILDLSKIEAGKMELETELVSVAEVVDDMRGLFEPVAKEKKLDLQMTIAGSAPEQIETDKLRLEQVLKNLLSNALKFTREGSVSMEVAGDSVREGYISFTVKDTGIGISKDKQGLIFEAFQQADGSTRRKYGGTGLGLSISKELSRLLGGGIELKSKPGAGSTFTVYIPVSPSASAAMTPVTEPEAAAGTDAPAPVAEDDTYLAPVIPEAIPDDRAAITPGDKCILIVEDDIHFAKTMLDFTRKKGYKGIVSVRGDEALDLARKHKPVGILLDIQLPVKSGWQVMEALKNDPATRHIPVHIMSSHSAKKESLLKGAINFINKPVAFEQLQEVFNKLEYVLNRSDKKVLIVEENPKHAKALAYFLETFNINSDIKTTVSESVDALQQDADCVILDMGIPAGHAYETLEAIKKTPGLEYLPIIVFTGKSLSLGEEQRIKQYADSIVVKTAQSFQRILDEVTLFLHVVEERNGQSTEKRQRRTGLLGEMLKGKKVLVVDDDVRNIFSLTRALEAAGMEVITAVDGKEAIDRLHEASRVDVVLLDMMMPLMDGYETARRIRQNPDWKRLPVIAVTAKAMTGDREKCIQAGASDYITKPIDMDQLLSLLRVWLYEGATSANS